MMTAMRLGIRQIRKRTLFAEQLKSKLSFPYPGCIGMRYTSYLFLWGRIKPKTEPLPNASRPALHQHLAAFDFIFLLEYKQFWSK